jgi:hypothetical protein
MKTSGSRNTSFFTKVKEREVGVRELKGRMYGAAPAKKSGK